MLHIAKPTRILLVVMGIIVVTGVITAWLYYRYENAAEDPRITETRIWLGRYDDLMQAGNYEEGLLLLDSIEQIYLRIPCYATSFEIGVLQNNRASVWITLGLYKTTDSTQRAEMLVLAEKAVREAIQSYQNWLQQVDSLSPAQIREMAVACFPVTDPALQGENVDRLINRRIENMELGITETKRRLSVAWSNLGIVQRHQYQQDSAVISYITALKLWKRNPTAKNNLNILLGKPAEDPSIIEQLFPPDRRKPD